MDANRVVVRRHTGSRRVAAAGRIEITFVHHFDMNSLRMIETVLDSVRTRSQITLP